jgi:hypothetical protein
VGISAFPQEIERIAGGNPEVKTGISAPKIKTNSKFKFVFINCGR